VLISLNICRSTCIKAKFYTYFKSLVFLFYFIGGNFLCTAQDQPGLSGFFQLSGSYFSFRTNTISAFLRNSTSETITHSLQEKPLKQQLYSTLVATELRYTFPKRKYQLYFGGSMLDLVRLEMIQQLAFRRLLVNNGFISVGVIGASIPVAVWEDPYAVGIERVGTNRNTKGIRVEWSNIYNSNFVLRYDIRSIKINERSGDFLALMPEERTMLDRNGSVHRLTLGYHKKYGEQHTIIPSLIFGYSNANGEAKKGYGLSLDVSHIYKKNRLAFATNITGGIRKYRANNPIYDKRQTNGEFGFTESVFYQLNNNPRATLLLNATFAYVLSDSNIDFHSQSSLLAQVGIVLRFGPILQPKGSKEP